MAGQLVREQSGNAWRVAMWGGAACLLLLPAIAMQFTPVIWGPEDFLTMGAMLAIACGAFEVAVRLIRGNLHRALAGAAILGVFLLVWVELAVDIFH